ncbi:MAG TPA: hypothetical protein VM554_09315 [Acidisarcina sp.]|nr:hypothetical protein [Acidisarcina sp.]
MHKTTRLWMVLGAAAAMAVCGSAVAQNKDNDAGAKPATNAMRALPSGDEAKSADARYFHLEFVVKEVELGKVLNSRSFITSASDQRGSSCSIRAGARIPVLQGGDHSQFQYLDAGVNIDCNRLSMRGNELAMYIKGEVSTFATDMPQESSAHATSGAETKSRSSDSGGLPPVIRQNRWEAMTVVPLGKTTTIFSSDDISSRQKMQVELTVTEIH